MKYEDIKHLNNKELSEFKGVFFAFSQKQFDEGMKSIGLDPKDTDKIYKLGAGGFVLKDKSKAFHAMFESWEKRLADFLATKEGLLEALIYELGNHEYCITYDDSDTLDALDLDPKTVDQDILKQAKKIYLDGCNQAA